MRGCVGLRVSEGGMGVRVGEDRHFGETDEKVAIDV